MRVRLGYYPAHEGQVTPCDTLEIQICRELHEAFQELWGRRDIRVGTRFTDEGDLHVFRLDTGTKFTGKGVVEGFLGVQWSECDAEPSPHLLGRAFALQDVTWRGDTAQLFVTLPSPDVTELPKRVWRRGQPAPHRLALEPGRVRL